MGHPRTARPRPARTTCAGSSTARTCGEAAETETEATASAALTTITRTPRAALVTTRRSTG
ncbi:hypothetical protein [Austwickia chelonae]|uniref:hypothetical protein n=1 Tax=Austwickia chelonae TaxID=100225 RepID=UPI001FE08216|nr:hypothetical protein [Austwickia chelonae]